PTASSSACVLPPPPSTATSPLSLHDALPIFFNREYVENTIKNILTIPASRVSFIMSKTLLLFMWIMMLTMIAWFPTLFLGLLTQFDGLDISLLVESFKEFSIGGVLLFILSTPIILVTLVMKNYVPTIIFTVVITLINV